MNALDSWLIRLFQRLVDACGLRPRHLVVAGAGVCALCDVAIAASGQGWYRVFYFAVAAAWMLTAVVVAEMCQSDAGFAAFQDQQSVRWRIFFFVLSILDCVVLLGALVAGTSPLGPKTISVLEGLSALAFMYFAICNDPPPPRRRFNPTPA